MTWEITLVLGILFVALILFITEVLRMDVVALLVLGVLLISLVDNVLRPWLIADRSQLNGLFVFVSILGGIQAFGLLGVVLGPLVAATAVGLLSGYRDAVRSESPRTS